MVTTSSANPLSWDLKQREKIAHTRNRKKQRIKKKYYKSTARDVSVAIYSFRIDFRVFSINVPFVLFAV